MKAINIPLLAGTIAAAITAIAMPYLTEGSDGSAAAEAPATPVLKLSCLRMGDITYFRFTDLNQGRNAESVVPVSKIAFWNTERSPENKIFLHAGYHNGYLAILPKEAVGMTNLQAVHHCVANAANYTGS